MCLLYRLVKLHDGIYNWQEQVSINPASMVALPSMACRKTESCSSSWGVDNDLFDQIFPLLLALS
jgi:hypothetical protein